MGDKETEQEVKTLKKEIAGLKEDIAQAMGSTISSFGRRMRTMSDRLSSQAQRRMEQFRERYGDVKDYGRQAASRAEERIRKRPLAALGVALLAGLIVGRILAGRRR